MKGVFDMFINFKCPHCGTALQDLSDLAGKKSKCPRCKKTIVVPQRESETHSTTEQAAMEH
jgi:phage FluMu protein Com